MDRREFIGGAAAAFAANCIGAAVAAEPAADTAALAAT